MKFIIIGNKSTFTYKSVFPLIRERRLRLGARCGGAMFFDTPRGVQQGFGNACWLTNLRHDVRRCLPPLKTMAENLATNKRLRKHLLERYGRLEYPRYDNYAAIEVPFVDAIPSDYDGTMGVPVTFLDKWDPDGVTELVAPGEGSLAGSAGVGVNHRGRTDVAVNGGCVYRRVLIQPRHELVDANDYRVSDSVPCKPHGLVKDKEAAVDGRPTYCRLLIRPAKEIRP